MSEQILNMSGRVRSGFEHLHLFRPVFHLPLPALLPIAETFLRRTSSFVYLDATGRGVPLRATLGVEQGDVLGPLLFAMAFRAPLERLRRRLVDLFSIVRSSFQLKSNWNNKKSNDSLDLGIIAYEPRFEPRFESPTPPIRLGL